MATSTELLTGGFFALGGVLLTKVFDLLGNSSKAKHDLRRELRAKHFEKKLGVYRKLAVALEPMVVSGSTMPSVAELREIQRELLQVHSPSRSDRHNASGAARAIKTRCAQAPRHSTPPCSTTALSSYSPRKCRIA
jgi:hypothetical protein